MGDEPPAERERKPFGLIKFRAKDPTGLADDDVHCGLVGSVTFCLFSYKLDQRPQEAAYAIHCYWEMQQRGLISETDVPDNPDEYGSMIHQWRGGDLRDVRLKLFPTEGDATLAMHGIPPSTLP